MADFLTRMVERTLDMMPVVQPMASSIYAPENVGTPFLAPTMDIQTGPIGLDSNADLEAAKESSGDWQQTAQQVPAAPGRNSWDQPLMRKSRGRLIAPSADLSASAASRQQSASPSQIFPESGSLENKADKSVLSPQHQPPNPVPRPLQPQNVGASAEPRAVRFNLSQPAPIDPASTSEPSEQAGTEPEIRSETSLLLPSSNVPPQQARGSAAAKGPRSVQGESVTRTDSPAQSSQVQHEGIQEPSRQDDVPFITPSEDKDRPLIGGRADEHPYERPYHASFMPGSSTPTSSSSTTGREHAGQSLGRPQGSQPLHSAAPALTDAINRAPRARQDSPASAPAGATSSGSLLETKVKSPLEEAADMLPSGLLVPGFLAGEMSGELEMEGRASGSHGASMDDKADQSALGTINRPLHVAPTTERTTLTPTEKRSAASLQKENSTPNIRVTIGRIDVRATPSSSPGSAPTSGSRSSRPAVSLDDYLKQRNGGRR